MLKLLDHPNILRLFEIFVDDKRYCLVTELWSGKDLYEVIAKQAIFKEAEAAIIIKKLLEAVAYCHSKNLVHWDIKPENILYNKETKDVKLFDFSSWQILTPKTKIKSTYGKLPSLLIF